MHVQFRLALRPCIVLQHIIINEKQTKPQICSHCDLFFNVEQPRYMQNHKKIQISRGHKTFEFSTLRVVTEHLIPVHEPSAHGVGWRWQVYDGALHLGHHAYAVSYPLGSYSAVLQTLQSRENFHIIQQLVE